MAVLSGPTWKASFSALLPTGCRLCEQVCVLLEPEHRCETAGSRPRAFAYGTRATPFAGDPQTNDDIFPLPRRQHHQRAKRFQPVLHLAATPALAAADAVANGTGYRVNWELVPPGEARGREQGGPAGALVVFYSQARKDCRRLGCRERRHRRDLPATARKEPGVSTASTWACSCWNERGHCPRRP